MSATQIASVMSGVVNSSKSSSSALVGDLTTATITELIQAAARGNRQAIRLLARIEQQAQAMNPTPQAAGMASTQQRSAGVEIDYLT